MKQMNAMMLEGIHDLNQTKTPLVPRSVDIPMPADNEVLIRVAACGVCHPELDEIEGRTPPPRYPVIPGHQVVGRIEQPGPGAERFSIGQRVGVAWINRSCGSCDFCLDGQENLCPDFAATGRDVHGGYAEYMTVPESFAFPIPGIFSDTEAAPLLCAGAIGYRSLRLANLKDGQRLGLTGFGASGHLVLKMARHRYPLSEIYVFARNPYFHRIDTAGPYLLAVFHHGARVSPDALVQLLTSDKRLAFLPPGTLRLDVSGFASPVDRVSYMMDVLRSL